MMNVLGGISNALMRNATVHSGRYSSLSRCSAYSIGIEKFSRRKT